MITSEVFEGLLNCIMPRLASLASRTRANLLSRFSTVTELGFSNAEQPRKENKWMGWKQKQHDGKKPGC